jgi:hypothetical protein
MPTATSVSRTGRALVGACALALAGCGGLFGRAPVEREITVNLEVSRREAIRRTLETFRVQGYTVRESLTGASEPETEPFIHRGTEQAEAVFRAAITGSDRSSRIVLTGTYRKRQLAGIVRGNEREVRKTDDPLERELWDRLYNLSLVIRRPSSGR